MLFVTSYFAVIILDAMCEHAYLFWLVKAHRCASLFLIYHTFLAAFANTVSPPGQYV